MPGSVGHRNLKRNKVEALVSRAVGQGDILRV